MHFWAFTGWLEVVQSFELGVGWLDPGGGGGVYFESKARPAWV